MSSIRSILDKLAIAATFYGISDKNTKPSVDQALKEIEEAIDGAKPKLMEDTSLIYKKWGVEMILNEYQSNLKELLK
jgi:N-acetylmuramic acid 6-phosphate (MurNAc-6-P) etherase